MNTVTIGDVSLSYLKTSRRFTSFFSYLQHFSCSFTLCFNRQNHQITSSSYQRISLMLAMMLAPKREAKSCLYYRVTFKHLKQKCRNWNLSKVAVRFTIQATNIWTDFNANISKYKAKEGMQVLLQKPLITITDC